MNKFLGEWGNKEDLARDFSIDVKTLKGINIVVAWYGQECYEGSAFVLFRQNGKLYEVNASHCSCYGLEDQWDPEETSKAALMHRLTNGSSFDYYQDGGHVKARLLKYCSRLRS